MKKVCCILLAVSAVFLITGCSQKDNSQELYQTVSISLPNVSDPRARTIMPDKLESADYYAVTLTADPDNGETKYFPSLAASGTSLTLESVALGSYSVDIKGYDETGDTDTLVLEGDSGENKLVVSVNGANSIEIKLNAVERIDEGLTGTVVINVDFSEVSSLERFTQMLSNGGFTVKMFDLDNPGEPLAKATLASADSTTLTLSAERPTTDPEGMEVYFSLYNGETLIAKNLHRSVLHVYSGNTSYDDEGDIVITEADLAYGVNVKNAKWSYNTNNKDYIDISWDNVFSQGSQLFDQVVVSYTPKSGGETKTITAKDIEDAKKSSVTIEDLETDVEYKISIQAFHKSGLVSSNDVQDFTITKITPVKSITLVPQSVQTVQDKTFTISYSITPDDASVKTVTWDFDASYFEKISDNGSSAKFRSLKAGKSTITAKTDEINSKVSAQTEVTAKLSAPEDVTADTTTGPGVIITWAAVENADSYTIYRADGNGEFTVLKSGIGGTNYSDGAVFSGQQYKYKVKAIGTADGISVDSDYSEASGNVPIPESSISIKIPENAETLNIEISSGGMLSFVDGERLTFSAVSSDGQEIDGITKYAWYIGTLENPISKESTLIVSADSKNYFDMEKVPVDGAYQQTLTLVVIYNGKQYSGSVDFYYIEEVVNYDVTQLEAKTLETEPKTGTRFSTLTSDGQERIIQLVTDTSSSILKDVVISIAMTDDSNGNPSEIAEYNPENGTLELKGGTGDITITATPKYGNGASETRDLSIYKATIHDAVSLVNAINTEWRKAFELADEKFGKDWARSGLESLEGPLDYNSNNFYFHRGEHTLSGSLSYISGATINIGGEGNDITVSSDGNLMFSLYDAWDGKGSAVGTEYITVISNDSSNSQDLTVTLPFNQGTATITYDNIRVRDDNGNNKDDKGNDIRGGRYIVDFSSEILGYDGKNLDETIIDADHAKDITKLIY